MYVAYLLTKVGRGTARTRFGTIRAALNQAVRERLITRNPWLYYGYAPYASGTLRFSAPYGYGLLTAEAIYGLYGSFDIFTLRSAQDTTTARNPPAVDRASEVP